ncbi:MAG TPA: SWIM zinc finger family protein [bacterium]|nr:SWIM zinc finger family protein [bacterium]
MTEKPSSFNLLLTRDALRRLTDSRSFSRGVEYFNAELVESITEYKGVITAKVLGSYEYRVRLWVDGDALDYECTCPRGEDGDFCKHCVAVGLAWLAQKETGAGKRKTRKKPNVTMEDVQDHLLKQEKAKLVDLLMQQVIDDDTLRRSLELEVLSARAGRIDIDAYKCAIDQAMRTGGYVDYGRAHDYTRGIDNIADTLEEILEKGFAAEVIELAEYALTVLDSEMGHVDDSDGYASDVLSRFQEIHHAACLKGKPDPEELAVRLFAWELKSDWDAFYGAFDTYADVLGEKGAERYRKLAEAEWAKVKSAEPGRRNDTHNGDHRYRITGIMENLVQQTGDVEALVAVKSRDLSHAYDYLQIAEIYKEAKQYDKAFEWAMKGVKTFPKRTDSRLREFLANEHHRRKRHDQAMELIWAIFADKPDLGEYKTLKDHAVRAKAWPHWREKALAFVRDQIETEKRKRATNRYAWGRSADHSTLVEIFLFEGDAEAAWNEAKAGGCSEHLWLKLADMREKDHPEDTLTVYQDRVEPTLAQTNENAYRTTIRYLDKIRTLMERLGKADAFPTYVNSVREKNKRKRNFVKRLDRKKWLPKSGG